MIRAQRPVCHHPDAWHRMALLHGKATEEARPVYDQQEVAAGSACRSATTIAGRATEEGRHPPADPTVQPIRRDERRRASWAGPLSDLGGYTQ